MLPMLLAQYRLAGYDEGQQQQHYTFKSTSKATCSNGPEVYKEREETYLTDMFETLRSNPVRVCVRMVRAISVNASLRSPPGR